MALINYTSYDEVRFILGVNSDMVTDAQLGLTLVAQLLTSDLEAIHVDLPTDYATTVDDASRTALQQRFVDLVQVFSAYSVARDTARSNPGIFGTKRITDGRAEVENFDPGEGRMVDLESMYATLRARLVDVYTELFPAAAVTETLMTFVTSTGLALDPVTNT